MNVFQFVSYQSQDKQGCCKQTDGLGVKSELKILKLKGKKIKIKY